MNLIKLPRLHCEPHEHDDSNSDDHAEHGYTYIKGGHRYHCLFSQSSTVSFSQLFEPKYTRTHTPRTNRVSRIHFIFHLLRCQQVDSKHGL